MAVGSSPASSLFMYNLRVLPMSCDVPSHMPCSSHKTCLCVHVYVRAPYDGVASLAGCAPAMCPGLPRMGCRPPMTLTRIS